MRRELRLHSLGDVITECNTLLISGYEATGNWTLGQMCAHIRLTMEANMRGYPRWMTTLGLPLRPILRKFVLPRLLKGNSVNGVRTAGMFVPPENLDDTLELQKLESCVQEFKNTVNALHAHPGFGLMEKEQFAIFHAAHAAHHLSFLTPRTSQESVESS